MKQNYSKQRKPIIVLICEGRNKTEIIYFRHFLKRDNKFNLKLIPSEDTSINGMVKKGENKINEFQLDNKIGDRLFCLVDLDLSNDRLKEIEKFKNNRGKCKVEFIVSNPCFEIWLQYYFTQNPKIVNTSQKVKAEMKKLVPQYEENFDVIEYYNLEDKHLNAVNNARNKNKIHDVDSLIVERNPYTEVYKLVEFLLGVSEL